MRVNQSTFGEWERWVDKIYPTKEEFLRALAKRTLKIYHGIDPTGPDLHLGHSTNLLLLEHFRRMGHEIILLIGDFTAMIGDPTEKEAARKPLTRTQVLKNAKTYQTQASKILSFTGKNPAKITYNSRWWGKMKFGDALALESLVTGPQLFERDMFERRIRAGEAVTLAEITYPFLQGYDSVALDIDTEVGGTDQTFNMLMGRDLMRKLKNKEKFVITTKLLENPKTGKKLMSKSEGTYVALSDPPDEMFAKVMALPDEVIIPCFELCTQVPDREIVELKKEVKENPLHTKKHLAFEIVKIYHGEKKATLARKEFEKVVQKKQSPSIPPVRSLEQIQDSLAIRYDWTPKSTASITQVVAVSADTSTSEAWRRVKGGTVSLDNVRITEPHAPFDFNVPHDRILKYGAHDYVKIKGKSKEDKGQKD